MILGCHFYREDQVSYQRRVKMKQNSVIVYIYIPFSFRISTQQTNKAGRVRIKNSFFRGRKIPHEREN